MGRSCKSVEGKCDLSVSTYWKACDACGIRAKSAEYASAQSLLRESSQNFKACDHGMRAKREKCTHVSAQHATCLAELNDQPPVRTQHTSERERRAPRNDLGA